MARLQTLPTVAETSLGPDKADRFPVPNRQEYVSSDEWNNLKNRVIEIAAAIGLEDGSTAGSIEEELDTLAASAGGDVLVQWNGSDLSQLTDGGTPDATTGTIAATVETGSRGDPVIRVEASVAGYFSYLFDPSLFASLPSRFVVDFDIDLFYASSTPSTPALPDAYVGPTLFADYQGSGSLGWSLCQYGNGDYMYQLYSRRAGTFGTAGATPTGKAPGNSALHGMLFRFETRQIIGATWAQFLRWHMMHDNGPNSQIESTGSNLADDGGAYDGETPNTVGFAGYLGTAGDGVDISRITIRQHPADVGL